MGSVKTNSSPQEEGCLYQHRETAEGGRLLDGGQSRLPPVRCQGGWKSLCEASGLWGKIFTFWKFSFFSFFFFPFAVRVYLYSSLELCADCSSYFPRAGKDVALRNGSKVKFLTGKLFGGFSPDFVIAQ